MHESVDITDPSFDGLRVFLLLSPSKYWGNKGFLDCEVVFNEHERVFLAGTQAHEYRCPLVGPHPIRVSRTAGLVFQLTHLVFEDKPMRGTIKQLLSGGHDFLRMFPDFGTVARPLIEMDLIRCTKNMPHPRRVYELRNDLRYVLMDPMMLGIFKRTPA